MTRSDRFRSARTSARRSPPRGFRSAFLALVRARQAFVAGEEPTIEPTHAEQLFERCMIDLDAQLTQHAPRPLYGRDGVVNDLIQMLAAPLERYPILLGRPGVGKTLTLYAIAERIRHGAAPEALRGLRLWETSPARLSLLISDESGSEALGAVWEELHRAPGLLILRNLDEIANYNELLAALPGLLRPVPGTRIRVLAEARPDRWRRLQSSDEALTALFVPVALDEPTGAALDELLAAACADLALQQEVTIAPAAIQRAVELTNRFLVNQAQPGKALQLLEETATLSAPDAQGQRLISAGDVVQRFAQRTGLRRELIDPDALWDENAVRRFFQERVLGQEQAIEAVVQRLTLLKAAVHDTRRPLGVFLFFGPTGVGKTELARALVEYLFGDEQRLTRFNMPDLDENDLFGYAHAWTLQGRRGQLTTRLNNQPLPVLLLDEFEKTKEKERELFQRFLQLFDEGTLINGAGEEINLRNSIIILTSNLAAELIYHSDIGFTSQRESAALEQRATRRVEEFYTPEFVNRIDQIVFFHPLTRTTIRLIARRELNELLRRDGVLRRGIEVEFDDSLVDWIVDRGYSQRFGARYLRRQIEKLISYPLAQALVTRPTPPGSLVRLYVQNERRRIRAAVIPPDEAGALQGTLIELEQDRRPLTLAELQRELPALCERVAQAAAFHDLPALRSERDELLAALSAPDFWEDDAAARRHLQRLGTLSTQVDLLDGLQRAAEDASHLLAELRSPAERGRLQALGRLYYRLQADLERAELDLLFGDELDPLGAWLTLTIDDSGDAAAAWLQELTRMYQGWARLRRFDATVIDEELGAVAGGTQRLRLRVDGYGAFALLRGERGTHRLVTGAESGGRVTLQAWVEVWPQHDAGQHPPGEITLRHTPLEGRGHLLKRRRCRVEALHQPTGLTITCVSDQPPADAEALARELLYGLLAVRRVPLPPGDDAWGDVRRIYQRHRDHGVRDLRTGLVATNVRKVLNGQIDPFLIAELRRRASERGTTR